MLFVATHSSTLFFQLKIIYLLRSIEKSKKLPNALTKRHAKKNNPKLSYIMWHYKTEKAL